MTTIVFTGEGYVFFQIQPALPNGLIFDPQTGSIAGTPTVLSAATEYTITATKRTGGTVTKTFTLVINPCAGDQSKVLFRIRADNYG